MIMFISVPVGGSASSSSNSNANANAGGGGPFFGGNKYHTVWTISKSNGKIVETRQIDAAIIYVFSWLGSEAWQKDSCGYAVHLYY